MKEALLIKFLSNFTRFTGLHKSLPNNDPIQYIAMLVVNHNHVMHGSFLCSSKAVLLNHVLTVVVCVYIKVCLQLRTCVQKYILLKTRYIENEKARREGEVSFNCSLRLHRIRLIIAFFHVAISFTDIIFPCLEKIVNQTCQMNIEQ